MIKIILHLLISALAVMVASYILPGIMVTGFMAALITALVLGLLNAFVRPVMIFLTLPVTIITLGLFIFVIDALIILLASNIVPGFAVSSFGWALAFSLVLSIVSSIFHAITV